MPNRRRKERRCRYHNQHDKSDDSDLSLLSETDDEDCSISREMNAEDCSIWHHLIFCEEINGDSCRLCNKPVLLGTPAYKCLECNCFQHKSCDDRPRRRSKSCDRHHLIFIEEDLQDNGGEEKKVVCWGCKDPTIRPAYKCSMPRCTFLIHKSCAEVPTRIKQPMHDPDHILLLQATSSEDLFYHCYVCREDCSESLFYSCSVEDCEFYLHCACAFPSIVNADDCRQHKLISSGKQVHFTCQSCGEETKDIACLCSECRVLIHGKCARFQHTIKTKTHDHCLIRTYSSLPHQLDCLIRTYFSLSHQLDVLCRLCCKKLNTEHAAYYCCPECGYVAHLHCANQVRDLRPPNEWVAVNSVDYQTHLVHLVEGINLAYDEKVSLPEIKHFSHPQHNLILSNEKPMDDMRCEACMQFIISCAPFYGCTQCKFFLHDRCARLPRKIQRGIFHEHSLTLRSHARDDNGLFECKACKRHRHGFVYNCSKCRRYNLDVQCCLIPEILKHEGHQHYLFLVRRFSETCNACGEDCEDDDLRLVCTNCNFTLCIRCAILPLVAKYQYDTDLLKLSYTREDDPEDYYCVICEEERNHPDHWFYYGVKSKFPAHSRCVVGDNPCIKFESTYISKFHHRIHPLTFFQKTHHSPPCDSCRKPFYGVALKCTKCKFNIHTPFYDKNPYSNGDNCLSIRGKMSGSKKTKKVSHIRYKTQ